MSGELRPRLCALDKGKDGYGFHLHGEKNKAGQFIRLVEPDSPAEESGLRPGDKLVFVNGESVDGASHQQVVSRIRAVTGKLELIVVDPETADLLKQHNLTCRREFVTDGVPIPRDTTDTAEEETNGTATEASPVPEPEPVPVPVFIPDTNGDFGITTLSLNSEYSLHFSPARAEFIHRETLRTEGHTPLNVIPQPCAGAVSQPAVAAVVPVMRTYAPTSTPKPLNNSQTLFILPPNPVGKESKAEFRPRLCHMKKGATGYGFNLHSEKTRQGQYIRAVDKDSPAEKSGLHPQDKVVQVNDVIVLGMQHSEVVAAIKAGGDELRLLVVDPETEAFFSRCQVEPTEQHLTGPLLTPPTSNDADEKVKEEAALEAKPTTPSPSPSSASSTASIPAETAASPLSEEKPEEKSKSDNTNAALDLNLSLQQAKERAHQKRSNKRAPPMDWSKRSEVFSNL